MDVFENSKQWSRGEQKDKISSLHSDKTGRCSVAMVGANVMQGPVFCFYEIMWLRGPWGCWSGEPVQLMMPQFQSGGEKWDGGGG